MKCKCVLVVICILNILVFASCSSTKSVLLYTKDKTDKIRFKLDTSDGWDMEEKLGIFAITKDHKDGFAAFPYERNDYDFMMEQLDLNGELTVIEESEKDGNSYTYYEDSSSKMYYVYIVKVKNTDLGAVIFGQNKELVEEGFEHITLSWK